MPKKPGDDLLGSLAAHDPGYTSKGSKHEHDSRTEVRSKGPTSPSLPGEILLNGENEQEQITQILSLSHTHRLCNHPKCPIKHLHSADRFDFDRPETWVLPPFAILEALSNVEVFEKDFQESQLYRWARTWVESEKYQKYKADQANLKICPTMREVMEIRGRLWHFQQVFQKSELCRMARVLFEGKGFKQWEADQTFLQECMKFHAEGLT